MQRSQRNVRSLDFVLGPPNVHPRLLPSLWKLWNCACPHPPRLNSLQVVRVNGVYRCPSVPTSIPPAFYPEVTLGAHFLAISLARGTCLTLALSSKRCRDGLEDPIKETSLSTVSFACHFVVSDAEYFCNFLYFEDFFGGCYCLANTVTHQNLLSKGGHKSKSTKQSGLAKPTKQEN